MNNKNVKKRWNAYFEKLLNEKYPLEAVKNVSWDEDVIDLINNKEVFWAVRTKKTSRETK